MSGKYFLITILVLVVIGIAVVALWRMGEQPQVVPATTVGPSSSMVGGVAPTDTPTPVPTEVEIVATPAPTPTPIFIVVTPTPTDTVTPTPPY